jgi:hypothetical protein
MNATPLPDRPRGARTSRWGEGGGLVDRFAQQVDQRVVDARVLIPADVRRSFKLPPEFGDVGENVLGA